MKDIVFEYKINKDSGPVYKDINVQWNESIEKMIEHYETSTTVYNRTDNHNLIDIKLSPDNNSFRIGILGYSITVRSNSFRLKGMTTSKEVFMRDVDKVIYNSIYVNVVDESRLHELAVKFMNEINPSYGAEMYDSLTILRRTQFHLYYLLKGIEDILSEYYTEDLYFRVKEMDDEYLELANMELKLL